MGIKVAAPSRCDPTHEAGELERVFPVENPISLNRGVTCILRGYTPILAQLTHGPSDLPYTPLTAPSSSDSRRTGDGAGPGCGSRSAPGGHIGSCGQHLCARGPAQVGTMIGPHRGAGRRIVANMLQNGAAPAVKARARSHMEAEPGSQRRGDEPLLLRTTRVGAKPRRCSSLAQGAEEHLPKAGTVRPPEIPLRPHSRLAERAFLGSFGQSAEAL